MEKPSIHHYENNWVNEHLCAGKLMKKDSNYDKMVSRERYSIGGVYLEFKYISVVSWDQI
jgi:hypothetical protein